MQFLKIGSKSPQKCQTLKTNVFLTIFLGMLALKKGSQFFCFVIRSVIFWHSKTGTFAESARFQLPKNGTSDAKTKKQRPLFNANIPQK